MELHPTTLHSSSRFMVDAANRKLTAEISELSEGSTRQVFCQTYDDACDEGFGIVSDKTGREATFVVSRLDELGGEIRAWELEPTRKTVRDCPELQGWVVVVFND